MSLAQCVSGLARPPEHALEAGSGGGPALFEELLAQFHACGEETDRINGPPGAGGKKKAPEHTGACMELLAFMYPAISQSALQSDLTSAAEGEGFGVEAEASGAHILEGYYSSGGKDTAPLPAETTAADSSAGTDEGIMARMPQIIGSSGDTDSKAVKQAEGPSSNLCPLENVSGGQTAVREPNSKAEADKPKTAGLSGDIPEPGFPLQAEENSIEQASAGREKQEKSELKTDESAPAPGRETTAVPESLPPEGDGLSDAQGEIRSSIDAALRQVDRLLSSYDSRGNRQFALQLEPESLGKLSISLSMGRDGLVARIHTENAEVQSILSDQIAQLVDRLNGSGIQVDRVDVLCADLGFGQDRQDSGGEQEKRRAFPGRIRLSGAEWPEYAGLNIFELYVNTGAGESSVEYRV